MTLWHIGRFTVLKSEGRKDFAFLLFTSSISHHSPVLYSRAVWLTGTNQGCQSQGYYFVRGSQLSAYTWRTSTTQGPLRVLRAGANSSLRHLLWSSPPCTGMPNWTCKELLPRASTQMISDLYEHNGCLLNRSPMTRHILFLLFASIPHHKFCQELQPATSSATKSFKYSKFRISQCYRSTIYFRLLNFIL